MVLREWINTSFDPSLNAKKPSTSNIRADTTKASILRYRTETCYEAYQLYMQVFYHFFIRFVVFPYLFGLICYRHKPFQTCGVKAKHLNNILPMALWVELMPIVGEEIPDTFETNLSSDGSEMITVKQWHIFDINDIKSNNVQYQELSFQRKTIKVAKVGEELGSMPIIACPWLNDQRLKDIDKLFCFSNELSVFNLPPVESSREIIQTLERWCSESEGKSTVDFVFDFIYIKFSNKILSI